MSSPIPDPEIIKKTFDNLKALEIGTPLNPVYPVLEKTSPEEREAILRDQAAARERLGKSARHRRSARQKSAGSSSPNSGKISAFSRALISRGWIPSAENPAEIGDRNFAILLGAEFWKFTISGEEIHRQNYSAGNIRIAENLARKFADRKIQIP